MKPFSALHTFALATLLTLPQALHAREEPPTVGAIRWDAWYGNGAVVQAVEAALGPPKYHFRLPWFARLLGEDRVRIDGNSPAIVEQEIAYAAEAGLNYWAFVHYWDEAPSMNLALQHYLATWDKRGISYCFVEEGSRLDRVGVAGWKQLVAHFRHPDYQTVLGGRPLLFVFGKTTRLDHAAWADLKRQTLAAGLETPYLVLMGWNPAQDARTMTALGFDAISSYARGGSYSMTQPSYAEQCALLRRQRWEQYRTLGLPHVTFASTGWDTRPRNERPPPWISRVTATPDSTPPAQQKPLLDSVTATPDELAAHVRDAVAWTQANRDLNPANTIILYAWNEHDEGGWIQPTLGRDGKPDVSRVTALGRVLRPSQSDRTATRP